MTATILVLGRGYATSMRPSSHTFEHASRIAVDLHPTSHRFIGFTNRSTNRSAVLHALARPAVKLLCRFLQLLLEILP